ncbi:DNA polymerase III subunit gamma and tau, partial [Streptomyces bungoensis]
MSSLALYRRYRPETFAEVIGQEHVTDPLQQALRNNRVNHAYLFSGPRGCGKTTSARILARCLNCEQGPTPTPCGECQSCRDLARNGPGSIDVIEIDAASHGGVDDARELREKAFFGPAGSRYKIYIIDEAHMVTSAGFNALLKVVEEPPEHLKFIFATTEPEKVIGTIRSRTHHYPFRLVPPGTLREYLGDVCRQEDIPVEEGVLPLVVRAGAGSVRDSMSVMDQLLAGAGAEGVTYAMATSLLGYTDGSLLDSVVEAFATGDGAAAFEVVDRIIEGGNDPRRFVADLLERLRDLVILAAVPDAVDKGLIDAPADVLERMQAQASTFGAAELSRAADLVNEGLTEMRGATSPRLQLELICARVMLPAAYGDERSVMARLDRLERGIGFSGGAGAPAMGYVPGPDAHAPVDAPARTAGVGGGGAPVPPGGGVAAARAAVRAQGAPAGAQGPGAGSGPVAAPPHAPAAAPAAGSGPAPVPAAAPAPAAPA